MRPKRLDLDPANANLTGFLSNSTGAGPWTMTTTTSGDGLAHQVSIRNDSATDYSGQTFTLVGTDADGKAISDVVTGPGNGATVESVKFFLTLTTSTASGAGIGADTIDYGWVDEFSTKTIPLDFYLSSPPVIQVDVTGTINFDIEVTLQNPYPNLTHENDAPFDVDEQADLSWINDANFTAKTATLVDDLATEGVKAIRLVVNSYTDTAELQVHISQPY